MRGLLVALLLAGVGSARAEVRPAGPDVGPDYSIPVAEGDWRVTVAFGSAAEAAKATIKAESRRLMVEPGGDGAVRSFVVNVRTAALPPPPAAAPGASAVRLNAREAGSYTWDNQLNLEVLGAKPVSVKVEPAPVPRILLLGDSTVADQRFEPAASWGQMLPRFFHPTVAVANHAESGETLKSFLTALRLDKALSQTRTGDLALIQFGHNDAKAQWPQTYAPADSTFRDYLRAYVGEFRRRGADVVLVTSPHRRTFGPDGRITNSHGGYPEAVKAVGRELDVPVIDLAAMSATFYEALGPELAPLAFSDGGRDATHHANYGAYELARAVAKGLLETGTPLAAHLVAGVGHYDPARPTPPEQFTLAPSAARSDQRPRGN
jgi:lysophospholipase L1-like esterase